MAEVDWTAGAEYSPLFFSVDGWCEEVVSQNLKLCMTCKFRLFKASGGKCDTRLDFFFRKGRQYILSIPLYFNYTPLKEEQYGTRKRKSCSHEL